MHNHYISIHTKNYKIIYLINSQLGIVQQLLANSEMNYTIRRRQLALRGDIRELEYQYLGQNRRVCLLKNHYSNAQKKHYSKSNDVPKSIASSGELCKHVYVDIKHYT